MLAAAAVASDARASVGNEARVVERAAELRACVAGTFTRSTRALHGHVSLSLLLQVPLLVRLLLQRLVCEGRRAFILTNLVYFLLAALIAAMLSMAVVVSVVVMMMMLVVVVDDVELVVLGARLQLRLELVRVQEVACATRTSPGVSANETAAAPGAVVAAGTSRAVEGCVTVVVTIEEEIDCEAIAFFRVQVRS